MTNMQTNKKEIDMKKPITKVGVRKVKMLVSRVEIDVFDPDYELRYPSGYIWKLIQKANEMGLKGKKVKLVEITESFATGSKYIDLIAEEFPTKPRTNGK